MALQNYLRTSWTYTSPDHLTFDVTALRLLGTAPPGTTHVGPTSTREEVWAIQSALFELQWVPGMTKAAFVTGAWSDATTRAVTDYRTAHAITHPPFTSGGAIEPVVDSLTLRYLDRHRTMLAVAKEEIWAVRVEPPRVLSLAQTAERETDFRIVHGTHTVTCAATITHPNPDPFTIWAEGEAPYQGPASVQWTESRGAVLYDGPPLILAEEVALP